MTNVAKSSPRFIVVFVKILEVTKYMTLHKPTLNDKLARRCIFHITHNYLNNVDKYFADEQQYFQIANAK